MKAEVSNRSVTLVSSLILVYVSKFCRDDEVGSFTRVEPDLLAPILGTDLTPGAFYCVVYWVVFTRLDILPPKAAFPNKSC